MKPHPRIGKTVKWGGIVIAAVLAIICLWSRDHWARLWLSGGGTWTLVSGRIELREIDWATRVPDWPGLDWGRGNGELQWGFSNVFGGFDTWMIIPLWVPAIVALASSRIAWRLDTLARRRESTGSCPACGYALTGLPAGSPCPECGRGAVSSANPVS